MILQNGKRIDGCSDTVPVGTLQPYLGLVPPKGYLACQGQLVSKITYSKLYEICGDTFGISTETHFYLPDLRGKTLAGYDENDMTMNTIGKLLGQKTHVHTTGNHTLTIAEMPAHTHNDGKNDEGITATVGGSTSAVMHWDSNSCELSTTSTGGGQAHNHGDTGASTNYQPTITVNWIVKAVMLIPDYIIVEDTLNSDSAVDALSARQGKLLNEKFTDYATKSEMIQYLPLSGGTLTGLLTLSGSGMETHDPAGVYMDIYGNLKHKRENDADTWGISNYTGDKTLVYTFGTGKLQVPGELYSEGKKIARFTAGNVVYDSTYAGGVFFFRVHNNGGNILMVGGALQIITEVPMRTPFITIEGITSSYSSYQYTLIATGSADVGFRLRAYNSGNNMVIDNEHCPLPVGWYNVTGFIYLRD